MIKDITLGQYFPGESIIHRTDPRVKIVLTIVFMITILVIESYTAFLLFAIFSFFAIIVSKIPVKYTLKGLKPIMFIVVFAAIMNIFFTPGTAIFKFKFITITIEGLDLAAKMALRLSLLVISTSLLTLTTTPIALTDGIERLFGPLKRIKVPVHEFALMMTIALRFIPTLLEETDKIMKAQTSRGADFDSGNIVQRAKSFVPILVPLFVSAFRRADELADAMNARCYRGGIGRTRMKELSFSRVDVLVSVVVLIVEIAIFWSN
ncbi:energy-coupling factor transporter transmembrane component T family protein [Acetivibrio cellulolyticus]|uniref:energy-coupling factor transporter transmembrane component T family protein n=1 Tax=Acetivibrio cellulolyticus TaxID=35830 RepID=UPI0001E2D139|nr:energy-coupling factor transporter transmembrane component T [Acetivibrio cellulolyticus]